MECRRLLACLLTLVVAVQAQAQQLAPVKYVDRGKEALPPRVREALWWLPERTESLIVVKGRPRSSVEAPDFHWFSFEDHLGLLKACLPRDRLNTLIESEPIEFTLSGGSRFSDKEIQIPGGAKYVGGKIVLFARRVARRVLNALLEPDGSQRRVTRRGPVVEVDRGYGYRAYFTNVDDRTLIFANNRAWLDTMMLRAKKRPTSRCLPPNLPEWRFVDTGATVWGLRHYRQESAKTSLTSMVRYDHGSQGLVFSYDPGRPLVVFRYVSTSTKSAQAFAQLWKGVIGDGVTLRDVDDRAVQVDLRISDDPQQYTPVEAFGVVLSLMGYTIYL